jgi:hypothetical protein
VAVAVSVGVAVTVLVDVAVLVGGVAVVVVVADGAWVAHGLSASGLPGGPVWTWFVSPQPQPGRSSVCPGGLENVTDAAFPLPLSPSLLARGGGLPRPVSLARAV